MTSFSSNYHDDYDAYTKIWKGLLFPKWQHESPCRNIQEFTGADVLSDMTRSSPAVNVQKEAVFYGSGAGAAKGEVQRWLNK